MINYFSHTTSINPPQNSQPCLDSRVHVPATQPLVLGVCDCQELLRGIGQGLESVSGGEFETIQRAGKLVEGTNLLDFFLVFIEFVEVDCAVDATRCQEVTIGNIRHRKKPRIFFMTIQERRHRLLLIHNPQIQRVVRVRARHEEVVVYHIYRIGIPLIILVKQVTVLIDFPKDDLAVQPAANNAIPRVSVHVSDIGDVAVVRVHVHHLTNIPHLQRPIIAHCVELVVFLIKFHRRNRIPVPHELLNLLLVVHVPNADYAVFAAADEVLAVG